MKKFDQIPTGLKDLFKDKSQKIKFSIGQVFCDFNELPKGVLFIKKGEVRLIYKDKNSEIFTVDRFKDGNIVGAEQLLCGTKGVAIKSSTQLEAQFLKRDYFIDYFKNNLLEINIFSNLSKYEYLKILIKLENQLKITDKDLIENLKHYEDKNTVQVKLFNPGEHSLKNISKRFFISSNNVKDHNEGDFLNNGEDFEVVGDLPARLIEIDELEFFSNKKEEISDFNQNDKTNKNLKNISQEKFLNTKDALADMFGSIEEKNNFPSFKGTDSNSNVLACLRMLSRYFDLPFKKDILKRILDDQNNNSLDNQINLSQLAALLNFIGLRTTPLKPDSESLIKRIPLPALFVLENNPLILWELKNNQFYIADPTKNPYWIDINKFENIIKKNNLKFLFLEKTPSSPKNRFGLSWFLPAIKKHKKTLFQVVLASFFVQLLALFNPLLIQQIIDAVINQGNISSLNVLGTLLISMALAQALLSSLRTYLFSDTTNRIDLSLGGKIINHLLRLPSGYFSKRTVGETSSRISELEKIREFLTGTALTLVLDVLFSIIYIAVMMIYSIQLTFVALSSNTIFYFINFFSISNNKTSN